MREKRKNAKQTGIGVSIMKAWLSCWLYVICAIGGVLAALIVCKLGVWPMWKILAALSDIILILHVMEEWKFPGGFYYMYNIQHGTAGTIVDRYPMSQQTDMFTNFVPILYGLIMLLIDAPFAAGLPWFGLAAMEVIVHTIAGLQMKTRFGKEGKKTLYNPGLATSWFGFLPVFAAFIVSFFMERMPTIMEAVIAVVITVVMTKCCINGAESGLKKEDSPYPYTWGKGYFKKFKDGMLNN